MSMFPSCHESWRRTIDRSLVPYEREIGRLHAAWLGHELTDVEYDRAITDCGRWFQRALRELLEVTA